MGEYATIEHGPLHDLAGTLHARLAARRVSHVDLVVTGEEDNLTGAGPHLIFFVSQMGIAPPRIARCRNEDGDGRDLDVLRPINPHALVADRQVGRGHGRLSRRPAAVVLAARAGDKQRDEDHEDENERTIATHLCPPLGCLPRHAIGLRVLSRAFLKLSILHYNSRFVKPYGANYGLTKAKSHRKT